jgi:hypothetical protein
MWRTRRRPSLRLTGAGKALVHGIRFQWNGTISGYGWLARAFKQAEAGFASDVYRELGAALFNPPAMRDVAATICELGAQPAWRKAARSLEAIFPVWCQRCPTAISTAPTTEASVRTTMSVKSSRRCKIPKLTPLLLPTNFVRNRSQAVTVSVLSEDGILLAKAAAPSR